MSLMAMVFLPSTFLTVRGLFGARVNLGADPLANSWHLGFSPFLA